MCAMWFRFRKPDPSFLCNGMLAGLVSVTAGCAYVAPWAAVLIGGLGGLLVVGSALHRSAALRDVATAGAAFLVSGPLEPGTALLLQVPGEDGDTLRSLPARVVHAARHEDGSWLVGCEFVDQLRDEDLAQLLLDATDDFEKPGRS